MRQVVEAQNGFQIPYIYSTLYHPTENLAMYNVFVKLKGRVEFWHNHKRYMYLE